jgi:inhibitor of cysteine peptidase
MRQVAITRAQQDDVVAVKRGDVIVVELPDQPSTGYRWDVASSDPALVEIEGSAYKGAGPGVGGGGITTWRLRARALGRTRLDFKRHRPWEGDRSVVDRFAVTLDIADG